MPIGSGIVYNTGDLILSQVSSSGTAFLETKIAAATSSLIYFDSTARINSASLNSITVGTASYVSGSTSIITNLTASNISASLTGSFGIVGIGTVNPAYKLDVNGNANFTNGFYTNTDASSTSYFVGANGTRPIIFQNNTATSYDFGFKFTDSNTFTIVGGNTLANPTTDLVSFTYDGKVGIGTTGPSVRLHLVTGSIGGTAYPLYVDNNSGGAGVNVVGIGFANGGIMKHSITTAIYGNDYMAFNVGQGASYNQERMRIDSNGNVGIGTTTVSTKLAVEGGSIATVNITGSDVKYSFDIRTLVGGAIGFNNAAASNVYGAVTGSAYFGVAQAYPIVFTTNGTERLRIESGGNIGIGITTSSAKLQVNGNVSGSSFTSSISNAVGFLGTSSWAQNVVSASFATTAQTANALNPANSYTITNLTASNISASGTSSFGYVGIGTSLPSYKLDVQPTSSTVRFGQSVVGAFPANPSVFAFFGHTSLDNVNTAANYAVLQSSTGDSFLNASSGRNIYFRLGNTDKMILNSSGQFGIGTTSPIAGFLDVRSIVTKSVAGPTNIAFFGSSDGGNPLGLVVNHESSSGVKMVGLVGTEYGLSGNNIKINETLHVQYSGNVGIGAINPNSKLTIYGSPSLDNTFTYLMNLLNTDSTITAGMGSGISFGSNITSGGGNNIAHLCGIIGIKENATSGNYAGALTFWTRINGAASAERLRIDSSGSVGIGTTSPNSKLEVAGPAGTAVVSVTNSGNGRSGSFGIDGNGVFIRNSNNGDYFDLENASGTSKFRVVYDNNTFLNTTYTSVGSLTASGSKLSVFGNLSVGSTYGAITASSNGAIFEGNVGIGSTSPGAKLDVVGDLRVKSAGAAIILDTTTASDGRMEYKYNGTRKALIGVDSDNLQISADSGNYLQFRTNGSQRMIINNAGGVGIGTSNPNYAFDVYTNGSADALMSIRASGSANARIYFDAANGDLTGGDYCHLGQDKSTLNFVINTGGSAGNIHLQPKEGTNNGILFVSGSTRFGLVSSQNHQFTGSVNISGSTNTSNVTTTTQVGGSSGTLVSYVTPGIYATGTSTGNAIGIISNTSFANNGVIANIGLNQSSSNVNDITAKVHMTIGGWYQNSGTGIPIYLGNGYTIESSPTMVIAPADANGGGNVGIGTTNPVAKLQVAGNISGSSFTSSISNAVGFLGTSSWAINASTASYVSPSGNAFVQGGNSFGTTATLGTNDASALIFETNGTGRVTIDTNGNVGIGTTSMVAKLDVYDNTDGGLLSFIRNANSGSNAYSAFVLRRDGNNNGIVLFTNSSTRTTDGGAGNSTIRTDNGNLLLGAGGSQHILTTAGNVGIGTTVPSARLHVTGSTGGIFEVDTAGGATTFYVSASGNVGIGTANATDKLTLYGALASYKTGADTIQTQVYLANTPNTRAFNVQLNSGGTGLDLWSYNSSNAWLRHTTFDYNGSVGIGTATSILGKLQLDSGVAPYYGPATGSATPNGMFTLGSVTGDVVNTFGVDASATAYAWIQPRKVTGATYYSLALNPNGGNVGIGTVTPTAKLEITGSSNSALLNIKSPISGAILYVSGSGAVGIGTSNVGAFTLQVSGSFGATTKSFIIDHPTKAGKKLMYGSLESPYHGIRLTGRDTLVNGKCKVELPDYMYKLILHDSINIQLTGIKCNKTLYVDDINIPENYFTIAYDKAIFESYKDYDFFWDFTAIRADVPELTTEL